MDKHTICLLNDSFPPIIDGVANAVVNYAENIEKHHGHAVVVTPGRAGRGRQRLSVSGGALPEHRHAPARRLRRGYPFRRRRRCACARRRSSCCTRIAPSPRRSSRARCARWWTPLVLTYHTKYDIDIAKAVKSRLLQESAIRALVQNVNACDEVWVVSRGAGENLRSLGYEGAYTCDGEWRGRAARARERRGGRRCDSGL